MGYNVKGCMGDDVKGYIIYFPINITVELKRVVRVFLETNENKKRGTLGQNIPQFKARFIV